MSKSALFRAPDIAERTTPPHMVALVGGSLFLAGAALTAVAMVLPRPIMLDTTGFWLICIAQLVLGTLMLTAGRLGHGAERWVAPTAVLSSIVIIGVAFELTYSETEAAVIINLFYVWPAIYAGYFFNRGIAAGVGALVLITYIASSLAADVGARALLLRGLIILSVVGGTGIVAHVVRRHVEGLIHKLDELARIDPLTGLLNRRGFDEHLSNEISRFRRTRRPLSLAVGDIDHFKAINDRHGHAAGDMVLQGIGETLLSSARGADVVARLGGEEFALLMPATGPDAALAAAERLRALVATVSDPGGAPVEITFGVTSTAEPGCQDADSLLLAADRALYVGKEGGGDRSVLYASGMGHGSQDRSETSPTPRQAPGGTRPSSRRAQAAPRSTR